MSKQNLSIIRILLICLINAPLLLKAGAWLPNHGDYNFSINYGRVDKTTKNLQKEQIKYSITAQDSISDLYYLIYLIKAEAIDKKRPLLNSEIRSLEEKRELIKTLKKISADLDSFNDRFFNYVDLEYAFSKYQSLGIVVGYKQDHPTTAIKPMLKEVKLDDKMLTTYYKHKLFQGKEFIITLQPKCHFSTHNNHTYSKYFDTGLLIGHSKKKKKHSSYSEIGFVARIPLHKNHGDVSYIISLNEGIKFKSGFSLSNFTQYEKIIGNKSVYGDTIYDQLAIAKEICFDDKKLKCFTAQVGYFWKEALNERLYKLPGYSIITAKYKISGPIFSLWLAI